MIVRVLYITVLVFSLGSLSAQTQLSWQPASKEETVAAYKKVCDWFINTNSYSFSLKYTSYKSPTSNEVIESSEGSYKRSGKKFASVAIGIKTIQNEKVRIIIDTADKLIAIANPGNLSPAMQTSEELTKLLENVKLLRKKNSNGTTTYRIDFKKNELYDAYEFTINSKNLLEKLVYYYAEQTDKDYGDGEEEKAIERKLKPRLEIVFSGYLAPSNVQDSEFNEQAIVLANNKISLLNKYKSYQVKDYRTPSKN